VTCYLQSNISLVAVDELKQSMSEVRRGSGEAVSTKLTELMCFTGGSGMLCLEAQRCVVNNVSFLTAIRPAVAYRSAAKRHIIYRFYKQIGSDPAGRKEGWEGDGNALISYSFTVNSHHKRR